MLIGKAMGSGGTDVSDTTATASDVVSPKKFHLADGTLATGSIQTKTSANMTASGLTVTAPAGYYASAASKTASDENLVAGNIKKNVVIFGVTGSYEGSGGGGLPVVSGMLNGSGDATLIITAPNGVDFSQYNRVVVYLVEGGSTNGDVLSTSYMGGRLIASLPVMFDGTSASFQSSLPLTTNFLSDRIVVQAPSSNFRFSQLYCYVAWKE